MLEKPNENPNFFTPVYTSWLDTDWQNVKIEFQHCKNPKIEGAGGDAQKCRKKCSDYLG